MKRFALAFFAAIVALAACQKIDGSDSAEQNIILSASIEQSTPTKTEIGDDKNIVWSENDRIVAFLKSASVSQFQILPSFVGKNYADFSIISSSNPTIGSATGSTLWPTILTAAQ